MREKMRNVWDFSSFRDILHLGYFNIIFRGILNDTPRILLYLLLGMYAFFFVMYHHYLYVFWEFISRFILAITH